MALPIHFDWRARVTIRSTTLNVCSVHGLNLSRLVHRATSIGRQPVKSRAGHDSCKADLDGDIREISVS